MSAWQLIKPRRPIPGYVLFLRASASADNGSVKENVHEWNASMKKKWDELSDMERESWAEKDRVDKANYIREKRGQKKDEVTSLSTLICHQLDFV